MPKVDVIIPTYNRAKIVGYAIQSVIDQTFTDWEAIVVDDGSQDNTSEVVAQFDDPRIRYIHQENKKLPGARNTGMRASSGEYIAFLDSDDRFLPEKLAVQVAALERNPDYGLVTSGWIDVGAEGEILEERRPWLIDAGLEHTDWLYRDPMITCGVLVKRTWVEKVGLFDEQLHHQEDYDFWLRLSFGGCRMFWEPALVCLRTCHEGSLSGEAAHMADGLFRILDKLFSRPDLPADIHSQREYIYGCHHVGVAVRFLIAGMATESRDHLAEAIRLDPTLLEGNPPALLKSLSSSILGYPNSNQQTYIQTVCQVLESLSTRLARSPRQFRAMIQADLTFRQLALGHRAKARQAAALTLLNDPSWLQNRGILSVLLKP